MSTPFTTAMLHIRPAQTIDAEPLLRLVRLFPTPTPPDDVAYRAAFQEKLVDGNSFLAVAETDQILVAIWALEADVNNGGFDQYYFNSSGDTAHYAPVALRAIGAMAAADIAERANLLFGPGGPPPSCNARQDALSALTDSEKDLWGDLDRQFYAYPDNIAALLERFLNQGATL